MLPIIVGLVPGVIVGTWLLKFVNPGWIKLWTYIAVLPLILVQAAGFRRPIKAEGKANLVFGGGVGVLYSVTTISGPPLAIMLNNQGFVKQEFRAGLSLVRLAESSFTAMAYYFAGIYTLQSFMLIPFIFPSIIIGVPARQLHHPQNGSGNIPADLHELRRVDRGIRPVQRAARSESHSGRQRLSGHGGGDR